MVPKSEWLLMFITFSFLLSSCNYLQANAVRNDKGKRIVISEECSNNEEEIWAPIMNVRSPKVLEYGKFAVEAMNSLECLNPDHKTMIFKKVHQGATQKQGQQLNIWIEVECMYKNKKNKDRPVYRVEMSEIESTNDKQVTNIIKRSEVDSTNYKEDTNTTKRPRK
ncbi:hypothetical protein CASFOL_040612 [Castilleja foliolosa]|uniref:Uncharacterized protein n=1 Tax=Castilleja foliolosa TaxID=1961234 RepID=A0ABD3BCX9_9LAMI